MFNFFGKKSKFVLPSFEYLTKYSHKDKYFYRTAQWFWLDDTHITIIDSHSPRFITLDPWPQLVFLDANGKLTITQYVEYMATKYKSKVPAQLDETIINEIEQLLKEKVIALSDAVQELHRDHDNAKDLKKKSSG